MTMSNSISNSLFSTIKAKSNDVAEFSKKENLSETDMIKFNMSASKYQMMVSLTANLVKNLTETEKQVANKM
ncbi:hypothetical protein [Halodesulfovibrio sp.]|uniref:hypothetical protein n=1 Tax=Halodesulfovibrio sp. TaxID=1912772 RepID=UPI0025BD25A4|nr:hypothetical protein [Halodesulfovibrio sp.]